MVFLRLLVSRRTCSGICKGSYFLAKPPSSLIAALNDLKTGNDFGIEGIFHVFESKGFVGSLKGTWLCLSVRC